MEDAFVNPARETIYLVMEYVVGDTIRKFVKTKSSQNGVEGLTETMT
jgi:hypothetical protein